MGNLTQLTRLYSNTLPPTPITFRLSQKSLRTQRDFSFGRDLNNLPYHSFRKTACLTISSNITNGNDPRTPMPTTPTVTIMLQPTAQPVWSQPSTV